MERASVIVRGNAAALLPVAGIVLLSVFALSVVAFGLDGVVKGAHDAFHDFRHVIGMPCH